jgi:hypothetical protein
VHRWLWQAMMETIRIARPRTAPPIVTVTEPPQAYIPNHGSANHARPEHNMPPQPEYRYQRLQRGQSAFGENDEGSARSGTTLTASSGEDQEQIQGNEYNNKSRKCSLLNLWERRSKRSFSCTVVDSARQRPPSEPLFTLDYRKGANYRQGSWL